MRITTAPRRIAPFVAAQVAHQGWIPLIDWTFSGCSQALSVRFLACQYHFPGIPVSTSQAGLRAIQPQSTMFQPSRSQGGSAQAASPVSAEQLALARRDAGFATLAFCMWLGLAIKVWPMLPGPKNAQSALGLIASTSGPCLAAALLVVSSCSAP
jgi:hypothetical protein